MDLQTLWFYRDQLQRIAEESLEVTLVICKADLAEFSIAKIFDIFYQILPTGFVLNTGYWPFFNSVKKQSICVCGRYGMICRHMRQQYHWIDLNKLDNDHSIAFNNAKPAMLTILDLGIELTPISNGTLGYSINMKLTFQYKRAEKGRPRGKRDGIDTEVFRALICSRYLLQKEFYPAIHTIMFQPSPLFYETYGCYFPKLLQARQNYGLSPMETRQTVYTALIENMPHFTLLLQCVNVPIYQESSPLMSASLFYRGPLKSRNSSISKSVQTDTSDEEKLSNYKELIAKLEPIWNDSMYTSRKFMYQNPAKKINNDITSGSRFLHRSIKQEIVDIDETFDSKSNSQGKEYQFENAVTKKRSRKRFENLQVIEQITANRSLNTLKAIPGTSYAAVVKSSKSSQAGLKCNLESDFTKSGSYKKDPEFQWLDTQFPDFRKTETVKQEKIDENFDIAEEFINQEKGRNSIDGGMWNAVAY